MQYRHAPADGFADLDAALVSAPGRPSLPVRLTLELFGRCREHLGGTGPVVVWDPCCGTGALLTTLGLLRGRQIGGLVGSDADPDPLRLAVRNLALLDPGGTEARGAELDVLAERHGKPGYSEAAAAARRLAPTTGAPPAEVGVADALDAGATGPIVARHRPMIVLADVPYGRQTRWAGADGSPGSAGPEARLVAALARVLDAASVIAVVTRARKVTLPPGTPALERLRAGHRAAAVVRAGEVR